MKKKTHKKPNKNKASIQSIIDKLLSDAARQAVEYYAINQIYQPLSQLDSNTIKLIQKKLSKMDKITSKNPFAKIMLQSNQSQNILPNLQAWTNNLVSQKDLECKFKQDQIKKALFVEDIGEKLSQSEFELLKKYTGIEQ